MWVPLSGGVLGCGVGVVGAVEAIQMGTPGVADFGVSPATEATELPFGAPAAIGGLGLGVVGWERLGLGGASAGLCVSVLEVGVCEALVCVVGLFCWLEVVGELGDAVSATDGLLVAVDGLLVGTGEGCVKGLGCGVAAGPAAGAS